jgi:aminoglycoside 6'-N-acetyltransferase I
MITIRRVEEHDREEWTRLRAALWPQMTPEQNAAEMADVWAHPQTMPVFVAEQPTGGLCGLMEVALRDTAPGCHTSPVGYLEAWYVDPAWRGQGIGRQLVEVAEAWARAQGCTEMASDTDQGYPLSPAAHRALGYVEVGREIYFRKALHDAEPTHE